MFSGYITQECESQAWQRRNAQQKFTLLERDDREEMYNKTEQYDPWREGHVGLDYIGLQCPVNNRGSSEIRGTLGKQKH